MPPHTDTSTTKYKWEGGDNASEKYGFGAGALKSRKASTSYSSSQHKGRRTQSHKRRRSDGKRGANSGAKACATCPLAAKNNSSNNHRHHHDETEEEQDTHYRHERGDDTRSDAENSHPSNRDTRIRGQAYSSDESFSSISSPSFSPDTSGSYESDASVIHCKRSGTCAVDSKKKKSPVTVSASKKTTQQKMYAQVPLPKNARLIITAGSRSSESSSMPSFGDEDTATESDASSVVHCSAKRNQKSSGSEYESSGPNQTERGGSHRVAARVRLCKINVHEDGWTTSDTDTAVNQDFESDTSFYASSPNPARQQRHGDRNQRRSSVPCYSKTRPNNNNKYRSRSPEWEPSPIPSASESPAQKPKNRPCESCPAEPAPLDGPLGLTTRTLRGCMLLCADRERRTTRWQWTVPLGVEWVIVTMAGGGGAGGCQTITGAVTTNGTGGQAAASFINRPVRVCYGQTLKISIGNGGVPRCSALTAVLEGAAATTAPITDFTFESAPTESRGFRESAKSAIGAVVPTGTRQVVLDSSDGAPTIIQCVNPDCTPAGRALFGQGGLSGDHLSDPDYADLLRFSTFGGFGGDPGTQGDASSSSAGDQALALSAERALVFAASTIPGQGGSSPFAAGGVPMVTPFPSTITPTSTAIGSLPTAAIVGPNGDMGSGGAGATTTFQAGFGGPGFVYIFW